MEEMKTILVVDDMKQIRTILRFGLEKAGYTVKVASSGQKALDIAIRDNPPDLIILDVMMPKMDGYEVIRRLRDSNVTRHIPVIFLTAKAQKKDVLKGMEVGANDYVVKPFKFADLNRKVEKLLDAHTGHLGVETVKQGLDKYNQTVSDKTKKVHFEDIQGATNNQEEQSLKRALAAIMITDIVDFSKQMESNEEHTFSKLLVNNEIIRDVISRNKGEEIKTIGDSFLIRFNSAVDAVSAGINIQNEFRKYNKDKNSVDHILVRIGIHVGDILLKNNDVFGDGINVVSRIGPLADPGGICISADVYNVVKKIIAIEVSSLGVRELKNIKDPPEIFKVIIEASD